MRFHHSDVVRQWFAAHDRMLVEYLPPYSPFLNPIEEFFSSWRWKVYDRHPHGPASGHGCSMWWHHSRVLQRVDSPLEEILSSLHCKRWYSLWCRWNYVARQRGTSGCAWMIYSTMYVVCSVPICTAILFTVVHSSTQREFMFVVNKGVFILLHNAVNKLELQRVYAVKMWNIHI